MDAKVKADSAGGLYVSVACQSDVGRRREVNEDALVIVDLTHTGRPLLPGQADNLEVGRRGLLLAVADGMGGAQAGEVASRMAVEQLVAALASTQAQSETDGLRQGLKTVNLHLYNASQQNPAYHGMGATLTAAIIYASKVWLGQVGDSRGYLIRGGRIEQVTKDQSMVQQLMDAGVITDKQAEDSPYRNVIISALGTAEELQPDLSVISLAKGDTLLLCSDGLSNKVNSDEARDIIRDSATLKDACSKLVALANERGGEDNITVIVARIEGDTLPVTEEQNEGAIQVKPL